MGESDKMVTALFGLAKKISPCVIFIDEVDTVLRKRGGDSGGNSWNASVAGTFLSEWDGITVDSTAPVLVLGATNRPHDIDEAFLRRMPFVVEVPVPSAHAREEILIAMLRNEPLGSDVELKTLADMTEGHTGSDLRELCRLAAINRMKCIMTTSKAKSILTRVSGKNGESIAEAPSSQVVTGEKDMTKKTDSSSAASDAKASERPFHMGDFEIAVCKMSGQADTLNQYPKSFW